MTEFICETCGVQHAARADDPGVPPDSCAICSDERQYVGWRGQRWTTLDDLRASRKIEVTPLPDESGAWSIETKPTIAIGQRAVLIQTPVGNLLWDSQSLIDDAAIVRIRELGGIAAIAISHPHFYSAMVEWSHAFDAPIWLHASDRDWVKRPDRAIRRWHGPEGDPLPGSGLRLVQVGGHFPGCTALVWPAGAAGRGALFCGDMPMVVADRDWLSFMYSYPNLIPMPPVEVDRITTTLLGHRFDRIYSSWPDRVLASGAHDALRRSAARYRERSARLPWT
ncbi:MAG: MBL fold metallo-hydrolase [Chloroflexota bacterium]|nr:MAG: MBL fold metallo-hydrolase [Chloroflexota bacterium]